MITHLETWLSEAATVLHHDFPDKSGKDSYILGHSTSQILVKKLPIAVTILLVFTSFETILAFDYIFLLGTGSSLTSSGWGTYQGQQPTGLQNSLRFLWRNSLPLSASGWLVLGVTFFRRGISRKWREMGFDRDVFDLMVKTRGAWSRLRLLSYLNEPRHKSELSTLSGLDWKEVDRELGLLQRFGLITLHAHSGSVKIYKLSEQGKLILKLVEELEARVPSRELIP